MALSCAPDMGAAYKSEGSECKTRLEYGLVPGACTCRCTALACRLRTPLFKHACEGSQAPHAPLVDEGGRHDDEGAPVRHVVLNGGCNRAAWEGVCTESTIAFTNHMTQQLDRPAPPVHDAGSSRQPALTQVVAQQPSLSPMSLTQVVAQAQPLVGAVGAPALGGRVHLDGAHSARRLAHAHLHTFVCRGAASLARLRSPQPTPAPLAVALGHKSPQPTTSTPSCAAQAPHSIVRPPPPAARSSRRHPLRQSTAPSRSWRWSSGSGAGWATRSSRSLHSGQQCE